MSHFQPMPAISPKSSSFYHPFEFDSNNNERNKHNSTSFYNLSQPNNFETHRQLAYTNSSDTAYSGSKASSRTSHYNDFNKSNSKHVANTSYHRVTPYFGKNKKRFGKPLVRQFNNSFKSVDGFPDKRYKNSQYDQTLYHQSSPSSTTNSLYSKYDYNIYNQGVDIYSPFLLNNDKSEISIEKVYHYIYTLKQSLHSTNVQLNDWVKNQLDQLNHVKQDHKNIHDDSVFEKMSQVSDTDSEDWTDVSNNEINKEIANSNDVNLDKNLNLINSNLSMSSIRDLWKGNKNNHLHSKIELSQQAVDNSYENDTNLKITQPVAYSTLKNQNTQSTTLIGHPSTEMSDSTLSIRTKFDIKENQNFEINSGLKPINVPTPQIIHDSITYKQSSISKQSTNSFPTTSTLLTPKLSSTDLRFLNEKKLSLILDLDNTLLHAYQTIKINADIDLMDFLDSNNNPELFKFSLSFMPNTEYYLKLRPNVREFLDSLTPYYELSVFTHATIEYADAVLSILDPDHTYFGDRVATRQERNNLEEPKLLSRLYPDLNPRFVLAFDDRVDIWQDLERDQIIEAECYHFLTNNQTKLMKLYPMQGSEIASNFNMVEPVIDHDQHLKYLAKVFIEIHSNFYNSPNTSTRVSSILSTRKKRTLENVGIFFTGFLKEGKKGETIMFSESEASHKEMAKAMGAESYSDMSDPRVTHVVALRPTTENYKKCKEKPFEHLKRVHYLWLYDCIGTWTKSDEKFFDPEELTNKQKPLTTPAQEHWAQRATSNPSQLHRGNTFTSSLGVKSLTALHSHSAEQLPTRIFTALGSNSTGSIVLSPFERVFIVSNNQEKSNSQLKTNSISQGNLSWNTSDVASKPISYSTSNQETSFSINSMSLQCSVPQALSSLRIPASLPMMSNPPYSASSALFGQFNTNSNFNSKSSISSPSGTYTQSTYIPSHFFETETLSNSAKSTTIP